GGYPPAMGSLVRDCTRVVHQSRRASSRRGGAPMRPPAGPSVGLGTEMVLVTDLYTAFGYSRLSRTMPDSASGTGVNRTVLPCTVTSVTPAARHTCRNAATAKSLLTDAGGVP